MARKRKPRQSETAADRHKSGFMARIREVYRPLLKELARGNLRAMTKEIEIAIRGHLEKNGIPLPPLEDE